jgi:hypothetical protein
MLEPDIVSNIVAPLVVFAILVFAFWHLERTK